LKFSVFIFPVFDSFICNPFNDIISQTILLDGLGNRRLDDIPANILFVTGASHAPILAGVIMMNGSGLGSAGHSDHVAPAVPAS